MTTTTTCARCSNPATHLVKNYWLGNRDGLERFGPDLPVCEAHGKSTLANVKAAGKDLKLEQI